MGRRHRRQKPVRTSRSGLPRPNGTIPRKRSLEVPLGLIGVAAVIGVVMIDNALSDPMLRNRYADQASCACDYGSQCRFEDGFWVGPWYAESPEDRDPGDPGPGVCPAGTPVGPGASGQGHGGAYFGGRGFGRAVEAERGYRGAVGVESGYRGGFGGRGSVRA